MAVVQEAAAGYRHRLAAVIELIEAVHEMGEPLDPQTGIDILAQANADLEKEVERLSKLGVTQRCATPEDFRDAHAVIAATRILWDLVGTMQLRKQPSRLMRMVLKARNLLYDEVLKPLMLSMPKDARTEPLRNATEWFYTLWSPEHLALLHQVLESTIAGKPAKKETREAARYLQAQFIGTLDLDRIRKEQKTAAQ